MNSQLAKGMLKMILAEVILGQRSQLDFKDLKSWESLMDGDASAACLTSLDIMAIHKGIQMAVSGESRTKPENVRTYVLYSYSHLPAQNPDDFLPKDTSCAKDHCKGKYNKAHQEELTSRIKSGLKLANLRSILDIQDFLETHLSGSSHLNRHKFCGHQINFEHQKAYLKRILDEFRDSDDPTV